MGLTTRKVCLKNLLKTWSLKCLDFIYAIKGVLIYFWGSIKGVQSISVNHFMQVYYVSLFITGVGERKDKAQNPNVFLSGYTGKVYSDAQYLLLLLIMFIFQTHNIFHVSYGVSSTRMKTLLKSQRRLSKCL